MHNRIGDTLDRGKIFWKEMRNLKLIPKTSDALHGFMPEELNKYFSSIPISSSEDLADFFTSISAASLESFPFTEVSEYEVILAVSHFKSQARGENGIPQSVIARALPVIASILKSYVMRLSSLGSFLRVGKRLES